MCESFPATYRDAAQAWYTKLPYDSISSFKEFSQKFITQFESSWRSRKNSSFFFSIWQEEGETLQTFMGHFMVAMLEVYGLELSIVMSALLRGLKARHFVTPFQGGSPKIPWSFCIISKNILMPRKEWWRRERKEGSTSTLKRVALSLLNPRSRVTKLDPITILGASPWWVRTFECLPEIDLDRNKV